MLRPTVLLLAALCVAAPCICSAEDGSTGLAFLKLGAGARAIGMGDAYVAVENVDVLLMHSEWFQGIRYEFAGGVQSDGRQAFGLGLVGLYTDEIEEREEEPDADPVGTFRVFDFSVTGSYARRLTERFDVGGSIKYLNETIAEHSATGFAVDLGAIYRVPMVPGLSAGLAVQNLGPQMRFRVDGFDLPVLSRVGAALEIPVEALNGDLTLVGDALVPIADGDVKIHGGMEFEYGGVFALRFGYRTGWDNQNVSAGLGAKVRNFRLDYAYVPFYSDLGDTHRFSLGFAL